MWKYLRILIYFSYGGFVLDAATLRCYRGGLANYETSDLDKPEVFIKSGCIKTSQRTMLNAHGFNDSPESISASAVIEVYLAKLIYNVIALDWSKEAYSADVTIVDTAAWYSLGAVLSSVAVGKKLANTLIILSDNGMDLMNTVLVGMSLGCPLLGHAGRGVRSKGKDVWLIIGLDPAKPLYEKPLSPLEPLDKQSARSVCCVHTDMGYFGLNESHCSSDIYLNYRNFIDGNHRQPGCPDRSEDSVCSHSLASYIHADAVKRPTTLIASGAVDYWAWEAANGTGTNIVDIGDENNMTLAQGNYYMTTNAMEPFGRSKEGLKE